MSGERASVRLPRRIVPICVSEPTGCAFPLRTSSTPAIKVVLTAPIPGSKIPSFPLAGAILAGFSMPLLCIGRSQDDRRKKSKLEKDLPQRKPAASPNKTVMMREERGIYKSAQHEALHL